MPDQSSRLDPKARWRSISVENRQEFVMDTPPRAVTLLAKDLRVTGQKAILKCKIISCQGIFAPTSRHEQRGARSRPFAKHVRRSGRQLEEPVRPQHHRSTRNQRQIGQHARLALAQIAVIRQAQILHRLLREMALVLHIMAEPEHRNDKRGEHQPRPQRVLIAPDLGACAQEQRVHNKKLLERSNFKINYKKSQTIVWDFFILEKSNYLLTTNK